METLSPDQWRALFNESRHSALHLEMRDVYAVEDERQRVAQFQATGRRDLTAEAQELERSWWLDLMRASRARGVRLRRARIISEPVTAYISYEHWGTPLNIMAGEEVRWLPRTKAARLALPGADFWLFDQQRVLFNHFTGDGGWIGNELVTDDPELAGWHYTKISKIEHGTTMPSEADLELWCFHCHAESEYADLVAMARGIERMYRELRPRSRTCTSASCPSARLTTPS